jgi:hypothetical protein
VLPGTTVWTLANLATTLRSLVAVLETSRAIRALIGASLTVVIAVVITVSALEQVSTVRTAIRIAIRIVSLIITVRISVCIAEESTISKVNIDVILGIFEERFRGVLGLVNHNV